MLRKLLALLLVISMVGMSSGLVWDFEKLFTGRQMVPYGAPWIADDQKMYFGTGKDVSLEYDEDGLNVLSIAGNTKVTGTLAVTDNVTIPDNKYLFLGTGLDSKFTYDEAGVDRVVYSGAGLRIADDTKLEFGSDGDATIEYDEDGDNVVKVTGSFSFAEPITVTKADGTAPFTITSSTKVTNLNADAVDGKSSTDFVLRDGSQALTANWDAGSYKITSSQFASDITTGTAPFEVASTTVVTNLNADKLDGQEGTYYGTASDVTALQGRTYLHVQTITNPIVAAADTIEGATTVNTGGFTKAAVDLDAQPDVPRKLSVTPNGELTAWILIEGTNIDDEAITEYVNFSASSSLASTTKAFKSITQITGAKTGGTDRDITVGQTDALGLDMTIDNDYQIMMVKFNGGIDATQTLVKDSTDVEKNTIDVAGTLDGSKTIWVYVIVE